MNAPCSIIDRSMTRAAYDARRRAAFNALQGIQQQMRAADYADSPGWARAQIQRRAQDVIEAVPSPYSWVEAFFLRQWKARRQRVEGLIRDRKYAVGGVCSNHWHCLTRDLRETLATWKRTPIHMVPAPLPRDRIQPDFQLSRAA
jgi:hypothetical protein